MMYSSLTLACTRRALRLTAGATLAATLVLTGCASPNHRAPVEDRKPQAQAPAGEGAATVAVTPEPGASTSSMAGAENAGKPGHYTVKPGDTLIRVGLDHGQNWRDIARWSQLENPNIIEVGQVLRVVPPTPDSPLVSAKPVAPAGKVESKPLDARAASASAHGAASAATAAAAAASAPAAAPVAPVAPPPVKDDEGMNWLWPAAGTVVAPFEEGKNKGLAIAGKAGDAVLAAADGRVVYAGSGLRGYGNLVIVKHNATFLTAYAHNQVLLVKEDQAVRRGQKIAEMGNSDAERVQLHFEIRRQGKPVDPLRLLPSR